MIDRFGQKRTMKQALVGYGGFAREVMSYMDLVLPCFVEDDYFNPSQPCSRRLSTFSPSEYELFIAIADPTIRERIVKTLPPETKYFTLIHPSATILQGPHDEFVSIGEGSYISAGCKIGCSTTIGKHAQLNWNTIIGHDCVIGDFFTTAPIAGAMGNNRIGNCVYFGANACSIEKISICSDVTIGAGATVVKDITEPGTYVGNPARKMVKR